MHIWKKEISIEKLNAIGANTLFETLGITFTKVEGRLLEAQMPVDARTIQPFGLLHGGASAALAESMGSLAGSFCVPEGCNVVGLEISASHLRPVRKGVVRGVCEPIRLGRSHQVWEIKIYNEDGEMCCIARHTTVVLNHTGSV